MPKYYAELLHTILKIFEILEYSTRQVNKSLLNQVHVENCSFSPHPQPLSKRARGAGKAFKVPLLEERA